MSELNSLRKRTIRNVRVCRIRKMRNPIQFKHWYSYRISEALNVRHTKRDPIGYIYIHRTDEQHFRLVPLQLEIVQPDNIDSCKDYLHTYTRPIPAEIFHSTLNRPIQNFPNRRLERWLQVNGPIGFLPWISKPAFDMTMNVFGRLREVDVKNVKVVPRISAHQVGWALYSRAHFFEQVWILICRGLSAEAGAQKRSITCAHQRAYNHFEVCPTDGIRSSISQLSKCGSHTIEIYE